MNSEAMRWLILFGLWVSGVYLWLLPHLVKRRRRA